jgi:hypothetical protein
MKFIAMQQCDLTKTDAVTVVSYSGLGVVNESEIMDGYPFHPVTGAQLNAASK